MYLYLYDNSLNNRRFATTLARIETRLTDLGIGGKIVRLSALRNITDLLADEVRGGVKTVVVVGNDKTLTEVVNIAARFDVAIGIIPIGPDNKIADSLGIPAGEAACEALSARRIKRLDVGKINNTYFLSGVTISGNDVTVECENQYRVTATGMAAEINICNFRPAFATNAAASFNPQDGLLEVFIKPIQRGFGAWFARSQPIKPSIIPFQKLAVKSREAVSAITDGQRVVKAPIQIEVVPQKLRLIVGKLNKL